MTPFLRCAPGVGFPVLAPAGARILATLDEYCRGMDVILTVTSGSEPMGRDPDDPHPRGCAVDVGLAGLTDIQIRHFNIAMRTALGPLFTVLIEAPTKEAAGSVADIAYLNPKATGLHMHIQPVKGTTWPPKET